MSTKLSPEERDAVIKTVYGEARGEGEAGMLAVAHVIRNRMMDHRWPSNAVSVVQQRLQFSTWNANDPNAEKIRNLSPKNKFYMTIGHLVDRVWAGDFDPTKFAVYYYAPRGMKGRKAPKWWNDAMKETGVQIQIGNHFFTGRVKKDKPVVAKAPKIIVASTTPKPSRKTTPKRPRVA